MIAPNSGRQKTRKIFMSLDHGGLRGAQAIAADGRLADLKKCAEPSSKLFRSLLGAYTQVNENTATDCFGSIREKPHVRGLVLGIIRRFRLIE